MRLANKTSAQPSARPQEKGRQELQEYLVEEYGFNPEDPVFMKLMADINWLISDTVNKVLDELVANTSNTLADGSNGDYVVPVVPLSAIEK